MIRFVRASLNFFSGLLSFTLFITLFVELIFMFLDIQLTLFFPIHYYLFLCLLFDVMVRTIIQPSKLFGYLRLGLGYLSVIPVFYAHQISLLPFDINMGVEQIFLLIIGMTRLQHLGYLFEPLRTNPTQSFVGGFLLMIFLGTLFLLMPMSYTQPIDFIDALFTSASAVCVTGLSVFDIGSVLTPFGQIILLVLIQVGGLGIMTFYALVSISFSNRFLSHESQQLQQGWSTESVTETFGLIKAIFFVTFFLEIIGAIFIYFHLPSTIHLFEQKLFYAVFHSVSAFCNAGFSLFSDSLSIFSNSMVIMLVFSVLIFVGGIGFPVIFELYHYYITREKKRMKLQTKLVINISLLLIMVGVIVLYVQQLFFIQDGGSISLMDAVFQSVSARTAGFTSIDMSTLSVASIWFILFLMFIGASPGSTGGGIKTTTFGLLMAALFSTILSKDRIQLFDRYVNYRMVFKALAILVMSFSVVFVSFFLLLITETIDFLPLLFESVSAFATVGFSLGITSELSVFGKCIIIFLMFFGRIGPLTLAFALARRPKVANYKFPDEPVLLG